MYCRETLEFYLGKTNDPKAQEVFDVFQKINRSFSALGKKFGEKTRWDFFIECVDFLNTKYSEKFSDLERLNKETLNDLLHAILWSVSRAQSDFIKEDYYGAESLALSCLEKIQQILIFQEYIINQVHFIERQN